MIIADTTYAFIESVLFENVSNSSSYAVFSARPSFSPVYWSVTSHIRGEINLSPVRNK